MRCFERIRDRSLKYVIGIDGGGSRARAVLYSINLGKTVDYSISGSLNYHNIGFENVIHNLNSLLNKFNKYVDESLIVLGLAGLDSKYDWDIWIEYLDRNYRNYILCHDTHIVLYAGSRGKPGIAVISGTGFNAYGWDGSREYYSGNWGYKIGDEASGYSIGREALRAVVRYFDGRGSKTLLADRIFGFLELKDFNDLINWIYNADVRDIAELSKLVCELVDYDDTARSIIEYAVNEAVLSIYAVSKRMGLKTGVYYTGGVFKCKLYRMLFISKLSTDFKEVVWIKEPVYGAVLLGVDKLTR